MDKIVLAMGMQIIQVAHGVSSLEVKLKTTYNNIDERLFEISNKFVLCGLIKFQVKHNVYKTVASGVNQLISFKLTKTFESDKLIYAVVVSSVDLNMAKRTYYCVGNETDNAPWQTFYERPILKREFDFILSLDVSSCNPTSNGFTFLADDTELSDFELRGVDGSVPMHKAVLAGFSPVMKTMFSGQWKEASEGAINIPNTSIVTLQLLKDYMYKQTLPVTVTEIEKLAALASCYMMSDLEDRCIVKLISILSAKNAAYLLCFAVKYNMEKLMLVILENVQSGALQVKDMKKHFCSRIKSKTNIEEM